MQIIEYKGKILLVLTARANKMTFYDGKMFVRYGIHLNEVKLGSEEFQKINSKFNQLCK